MLKSFNYHKKEKNQLTHKIKVSWQNWKIWAHSYIAEKKIVHFGKLFYISLIHDHDRKG